ncbi:MAG: PAS domain-containing sensor histidine kinase [Longimicrobiales bacterium]
MKHSDHSQDLLAILDGRGRVLLVSPSAECLLGFRTDELSGRRALRMVHPGDRALALARLRELSGDRPVLHLDARIRQAGGAFAPVRWSLSLGAHQRIYAVGRDRTEEARRAEAALNHEMAELRLRTAMELHDGILQTLTGASLQIAVARRLVRQDPAAAEELLAALGETVHAEQQEMRLYVDEVKGQEPLWPDGDHGLAGRIAAMLDRVRGIWGLSASLEGDIEDGLPAEVGRRILRIIQEATVNAARHGLAKSVAVTIGRDGPAIAIRIADDGHGFPFLGDYDADALREKRLGPLSLKHRVEDAGGRLSVRSTREGATVCVWLPMREEPAA